MNPDSITSVGIVGTGMIGCSLATLYLFHSCPVTLIGRREQALADARTEIIRNFEDLADHGVMTPADSDRCLELLTLSMDYADLKDTRFITEAVTEDVNVKASVYAQVEAHCPEDAILSSATSAISADILADHVSRKDRFLVAHPWNPPHLVPLVEVVMSRFTSDETAETTKAFLDSMGRRAVILRKNIPGFIGNRLQHAMLREALYLIEQGIATPEQIDEVVLYGFGPRYSSIGPMEHYDCAGLPLQKQVQSGLFPELCNATKPPQILFDLLDEGHLGMKSGRGMLDWSKIDPDDFRNRQRAPYYHFLKEDPK